MEPVNRLLTRAWLAHLAVEHVGDGLRVTGPSSAGALVQEIAARKPEVIDHLQAQGCGPLHIQPGRWPKRGKSARCPHCDKWLGYYRSEGEG